MIISSFLPLLFFFLLLIHCVILSLNCISLSLELHWQNSMYGKPHVVLLLYYMQCTCISWEKKSHSYLFWPVFQPALGFDMLLPVFRKLLATCYLGHASKAGWKALNKKRFGGMSKKHIANILLRNHCIWIYTDAFCFFKPLTQNDKYF